MKWMTRRGTWYGFLAAVLVLSAAWMAFSRVEASGQGELPVSPYAGFRAPEISLQTLEGGAVSLADLQGKVVIVNFWATWCTPCRLEMPALQAIHTELADEGLVVLGLNTLYQDSLDTVAVFVDDFGLTFPIVLDDTGDTARAYAIQATPTTFVIDRQGVIRLALVGGPLDEAFLFSEVEALLEEVD